MVYAEFTWRPSVAEYTIVLSFNQRGLGTYRLRSVSSRQPGSGPLARATLRSTESRHAANASPNGTPNACFAVRDRKSTRLNSSHSQISYAVFCLKKKK